MLTTRTKTLCLPIMMFGVATFFYLYEFLLRVSPNVLEKELFQAFDLNASTFGFFSSCWFAAYAPLQLPVGALTDKYGPRRLLTFAILLCALSTLALAYTHQFGVACFLRFLIGIGSAFAFISCLKICHVWFPVHWFPLLTALTVTIGTLGGAAGGKPLSMALAYFDWRQIMIFLGLVGIVVGVAAWKLIQDHNPNHPDHQGDNVSLVGFWQCVRVIIKQPQCWMVGVYALFVTAPTDAMGATWGTKFLVDVHGFSRDMASVPAVTMTCVGMAIGSPLLGWIAEFINNRKLTMAISSLVAAIALSLIVYLPHLTQMLASVLFFIFGAAGTYVLAFTMTRRIAPSQYVATAVGFVNMVSMFGSFFLTYIIGLLLDLVSQGATLPDGTPFYSVKSYHLSYFMVPLFYAISAILIVPFIKDVKR